MTMIATGLSKLDVKALREAEDLCFYNTDGKCEIVGRRKVEGKPYETEARYLITVQGRMTDYGHERYSSQSLDKYRCFAMVTNYRYSPSEIDTIVRQLREGDELTLDWIADGGNGYVKDAGLHEDFLYLLVKRGEKTMRYHVQSNICPENTARMIRLI